MISIWNHGQQGWLMGHGLRMSLRPRRSMLVGRPSESLEQRILLSLDSVGPVLRDFNGDDIEDVIEMQNDGEWWVGINDPLLPDAFATSVWADWADASNFVHVDYGDFNGDTNADIVGIDRWGNAWVGLSDGIDTFTTTLWATDLSGTLDHVAVADINDDGASDLVAFTSAGEWLVSRSNGTNGFFSGEVWADWADAANFAHVAVADFDNDEQFDDIAAFDQWGNWWVATGNGTAFVGASLWADWANASNFAKIEVADFSGDGATDVAAFDHWGNWWVATGDITGVVFPFLVTGFNDATLWADWANASNFVTVGVGQFTGDGAADVAGLDLWGNWWVATAVTDPVDPLSVATEFEPTALWANWGDPSILRDIDLFSFGAAETTDAAGFDTEGRWRVGLSNGSAFIDNSFWADWDPADTFATLNEDLSTQRRLNTLRLS